MEMTFNFESIFTKDVKLYCPELCKINFSLIAFVEASKKYEEISHACFRVIEDFNVLMTWIGKYATLYLLKMGTFVRVDLTSPLMPSSSVLRKSCEDAMQELENQMNEYLKRT